MFTDLGTAILAAIVLVFLVLVVFFGSTSQPVTILAPVLFSSIGSLLALVITDAALGLPAMIGQLLLIGIVVANSILLVDTALRNRRAGVPRDEALVSAARLRVRPVLMTALATIAALTPLAAGFSGEGGIISQSLGAVVIGGLLTATLLTLVIVPAVFSTFDSAGRRLARVFGRGAEPAMAGAPAGAAATAVPRRGALGKPRREPRDGSTGSPPPPVRGEGAREQAPDAPHVRQADEDPVPEYDDTADGRADAQYFDEEYDAPPAANGSATVESNGRNGGGGGLLGRLRRRSGR
jgi:HAE1 family hydrophobic/amphiphilic exporter-1